MMMLECSAMILGLSVEVELMSMNVDSVCQMLTVVDRS